MRGLIAAALLLTALPTTADAATYHVGPTKPIKQLTALPQLGPGDLVLVDGGATYNGGVLLEDDGTPRAPIVIRGVPVGGQRPIVAGGVNTIEVQGDNTTLEQLDLRGGSSRCFYHHAHRVTLRDSVVRDCPAHGILGADTDSGSLLLERVEVHHSGAGQQKHQIYMATDEGKHPDAVFRMVDCYVHDGNGGNNVKSRARRNEIYFNWIEGAVFHELELIGPDPGGDAEIPPSIREDSDVVGNVLRKTKTSYVTRLGGDGTGDTNGRYRFAYNTILTQPDGSAVFRLFDRIDSVEMHGNVFHAAGGGAVNLLREAEADWNAGRAVSGVRNWVKQGAANVPPEWTGTASGADPGLGADLRPVAGSPLLGLGPRTMPSPAGHPFPRPLTSPLFEPTKASASRPRVFVGPPDAGAFEALR